MDRISVIYEDADFVAINKPPGVLVHRTRLSTAKQRLSDNHGETVADWVYRRYPEARCVGDDPELRPGIVHRLDRDTSGVLIIAKRTSAFRYLKRLFAEHEISKRYLALVSGTLAGSGVITLPIGLKSGSTRRSVRARNLKLVKHAETCYRVIESFTHSSGPYTFLAAEPRTGRTHQLRVHFAATGHPVISDQLYGGSVQRVQAAALGLKHQFLHAESLEFTASSGSRVTVSADLSPDLERALALLRGDQRDHHQRS